MTYDEAVAVLVQRLESSGLTQAELARRTGFSRQRLNNWLKRRANPSFDDFVIWAEALDMAVTFEVVPVEQPQEVAVAAPDDLAPEDMDAIQDFAMAIIGGDDSLRRVLRGYAAGVAHQVAIADKAQAG